MEPKNSIPYSQEPSISPYLEQYQSNPHHPILFFHDPFQYGPPTYVLVRGFFFTFVTGLFLTGEELLAPHPTPKLEDHPLSVVRDCLFNIFAAILHN
jgi:hypothetical protein